jgi:hypothetical protein
MRKFFQFMIISTVVFVAIFTISTNANSRISSTLKTPHEDATVTISFDGLLAVCFGDPGRVSTGILNVAHHTPRLVIEQITPESKRTIATLTGAQLRGTTFIDVEGSAPTGVKRYFATTMSEDEKDFRWTVDIESDIFQRQLYIKEEKLFGKIHFSAGLFYGNNLSEETVKFQSAAGNELPFKRQIAEPAAMVKLTAGETLVIKTKGQTLRLPAQANARYQIAITNTPPADMANMNHFLFYYDVVGKPVTAYEPVVVKKAAFFPKPILCQAVVFSKSKLN